MWRFSLLLLLLLLPSPSWAQTSCTPPAAAEGSPGCQPTLTAPQGGDLLMLWRPSLFPGSLGTVPFSTVPPFVFGTPWTGHMIYQSATGLSVATGSGDCGTSPALNSGSSDNLGRVTVGSSTNGGKCTITFAAAWANAPVCAVSDETSANAVRPVVTTTTLAITGTLTAGDSLSYRCAGF